MIHQDQDECIYFHASDLITSKYFELHKLGDRSQDEEGTFDVIEFLWSRNDIGIWGRVTNKKDAAMGTASF